MITRRTLAKALSLCVLPAWGHGDESVEETSDLIYLTPIRSDGTESRCQAEVWFQAHEGALYVVTAQDAWRAEAVRRGLDEARVWVGDVGVWTSSNGSYRGLPSRRVAASFVTDKTLQEAVLDKMGRKYRMSWLLWGPRFRNGLADGSRVMLCYR